MFTINSCSQFKFYNPAAVRNMLADSQNAQVTDDTLVGHIDPFYDECHAYGRISGHQGKRKGSVAVPCHGFLSIPAFHEATLEKGFGVSKWDRPAMESTLDPSQRQPFRALVKGLVEAADDVPTSSRQLSGILRDLRALRRMGVYLMDVCARNHRGGRLVDFSVVWATPHFMFSVRLRWQVDRLCKQLDLVYFDAMAEELGVSTTVKATPNQEYNKKLRPKKR